jgi:very-short-patch-repair endonuclease
MICPHPQPLSQVWEKGLGDEGNLGNLVKAPDFFVRSMSNSPARVRGTITSIETAAKKLRKAQTPTEKMLWKALKGGKLAGLKFRRQHPVGNFILDFYCPAYKLAIEVDGEIHQTQMDYDAARTTQLEAHGYTVIRFSNEAVMQDVEKILTKILQAVDALSPSPSPKSGRGE